MFEHFAERKFLPTQLLPWYDDHTRRCCIPGHHETYKAVFVEERDLLREWVILAVTKGLQVLFSRLVG